MNAVHQFRHKTWQSSILFRSMKERPEEALFRAIAGGGFGKRAAVGLLAIVTAGLFVCTVVRS